VLGGLMLNNDAWRNVSDILTSARLLSRATPDHLRGDGEPRERERAARRGDAVRSAQFARALDKRAASASSRKIAETTPGASNVIAYAQIVRERSTLRQLISAANKIAESAFQPQGRPSSELLDMAESEVFRIHEGRLRDAGPEPVVPLLARAVERIEALYASRNPITGTADRLRRSRQEDRGSAVVRPHHRRGSTVDGQKRVMMNMVEHALMTDKPARCSSSRWRCRPTSW
jgi:replicative DNA helicase